MPFVFVPLLAFRHLLEVLLVNLVRIILVTLENLGASFWKFSWASRRSVSRRCVLSASFLEFLFRLFPVGVALSWCRRFLFYFSVAWRMSFSQSFWCPTMRFLVRFTCLFAGFIGGGCQFLKGLAKRLLDMDDFVAGQALQPEQNGAAPATSPLTVPISKPGSQSSLPAIHAPAPVPTTMKTPSTTHILWPAKKRGSRSAWKCSNFSAALASAVSSRRKAS